MHSIESLYSIFCTHPSISTDSRNCPKDGLFFALKGPNFDGNRYAESALHAGCRYVIVDDPSVVKDERYLLVPDVLTALQSLAKHHRRQWGKTIIGITGTNGKTTTKELMAAVLGQKQTVLYTQGNLNNHIGVPLTLLKLNEKHQLAIIEMGANHPGEIKALCALADPDYGLITNVGKAHLEGFKTFEGVIKTKGELYEHVANKNGHIFVNRSNPYLKTLAKKQNILAYATEAGSDIWGEANAESPQLIVNWYQNYNQHAGTAHTQLIGNYNLENAMAAIRVGMHFGVDNASIKQALENYHPSNNRSQLLKTAQNTLIVDAYNANPTSMMAAIRNFSQLKSENKVLILGSMKELGDHSESEHKNLIQELTQLEMPRVYLIGQEFASNNGDYPCFDQVDALIEFIQSNPLKDSTILLKGSRSNQLERLIPYL